MNTTATRQPPGNEREAELYGRADAHKRHTYQTRGVTAFCTCGEITDDVTGHVEAAATSGGAQAVMHFKLGTWPEYEASQAVT